MIVSVAVNRVVVTHRKSGDQSWVSRVLLETGKLRRAIAVQRLETGKLRRAITVHQGGGYKNNETETRKQQNTKIANSRNRTVAVVRPRRRP